MNEYLDIRALEARHGRQSTISNLSLRGIRPGKVTALIGPNAAGKTTLLRSIAGLHHARGSVTLGGVEMLGKAAAEQASSITYMPQMVSQGVVLTVMEAMLSALRATPLPGLPRSEIKAHALATLDRLGILDLAGRGLDQLSGGQRQLASLAQAIARRPRVLLLDEPTSALDLRAQLRVMQVLASVVQERNIIAVVTLHDLSQAARWADRLVIIDKGAIVADGPPEAALTPDMLRQVYGVEARVERCSHGHLHVSVDAIAPTHNAMGL